MKRIASLLMLAARSTLWKAAGITLASCLTEAGLFLAALSGWQDTVRTAYYEYSNPMGLEGLLMQYPLSWCFRIGLVLVCAVLAFLGWEGSSRVSYTLRRLSVGHRALTLLWAGYGFFCLLFFWAAHLGTLLALCAAALPVWHRSSPAPRLCSWPATATPISTACCPWMTGLSGRATCPCAPPWGRRRPVSPSNDAWAAGPSPFCPWRRSPPSAFPCPWAPLNLAGRRSSSAPISTTAFSTPRTVCPPSWGPSCFLSACAPWPPPLPDFEEGSL